MTTKQAIEYRNSFGNCTFKISGTSVMVKYNSELKFKRYGNLDIFVDSSIELRNNIISTTNFRNTISKLEELGFVADNKSVFGSVYFYTKNGHLRISNHHYTSFNHKNPEINLCSYAENGFIEMTSNAIEFLNK